MKQKILLIGIAMLTLMGCSGDHSIPVEPIEFPTASRTEPTQPADPGESGILIVSASIPDDQGAELESILGQETAAYLDNDFCQEEICSSGNWARWIFLEEESTWTIKDLAAIREALILSREALQDAGLDFNQVFNGYRFERHNDFYLDTGPGRYAAVRHEQKMIVLADQAFRRRDRFPILHELGHILDLKFERLLNEKFHALAGTTPSVAAGTKPQTEQGYWFRPQSEFSPTEATADAFALWIIMTYGRKEIPYFQNASRTADYTEITRAFSQAIGSIQTTSAQNSAIAAKE